MTDFLLELRSEEIPARMQDKARDDLRFAFESAMRAENLHQGTIVTYATPRRLTLIARDLADQTEAEVEEFKGPKAGAPDQAIDGFLRKLGADRATLDKRPDEKGVETYFVQRQKPSRATADVLAAIIPAIVRQFPWPKSMRWGAASASTESLRWVRPLHGIVALFGDDVVECEIAGVRSGAATVGHRFHHPGVITIGSAGDYEEKLRACHVIVDQDQRRAIIRERAAALAAEAGLELIADEGLVAENAGLTEWPVPLLGRFDEAFLEVPPEVIQLTARVNQKYFVCRDAGGSLANAFICTANIDAADGGAKIVEGNRKVLAARLSDARFFYETDLKVPLEEQAKKLGKIVFHEKLGTVADKVERVAKLARWLVEEGIIKSSPERGGGPFAQQMVEGAPLSTGNELRGEVGPLHHQPAAGGPPPRPGEDLALLADRAARLAKADLVTGMVGEFPELQGVMGGYYAAAQGENPAVADAIRDHYKPVGQGDDVPTDPVTVAVSLADKLDTISAFFGIGEKPTGSKDPFALRRAALGIVALVRENDLRIGTILASFAAVSPGIIAKQMERDRAPLIAALPAITQIVDRRNAEHFMRAIVETVMEMPDPRKPNPEAFREAVTIAADVRDFLLDRLEVAIRQDGARVDLVRAAQIIDGDKGREDDLVRLLARVRALQAFVGTEDGANLLAGYKRAANILKKEGYETPSPLVGEGRGPLASASGKGEGDSAASPTPPHPSGASRLPPSPTRGEGKIQLSYTPESTETALIVALDAAEPAAASAVQAEDFEAAMAALASLRAPIDAFFDSVTVNDPDPEKRAARLALLARVRDAVHGVADFSKIEG